MGRNLLVCALAVAACKAPPEAPVSLGDPTTGLYREWDNADAALVVSGLLELEAGLVDVDLTGDVLQRSWALPDLTPEDVATLPARPDRPPEDCVGVAVAWGSRWSIDDHALVQIQADQRPFEPTARDHYDRFFPETEDPTCFTEQTCERLFTFNEATRKNLLMTVTFELPKALRWVDLGDGRRAFFSRSWYEQPWAGQGDNVTLWQSYSLDVWIERDDGTTWRYQSLWSESDLGIGVSDDTVIATVRNATDTFYRACDDAIGEAFHGE